MTVLITLTIAGADTGPFDLYSNLDGYVTPFETGVSKVSLVSGYSSNLVPDGTQIIKVASTGNCLTYVFLILENSTTTTTSTSSTTTTTTTTIPDCIEYTVGTLAKIDQHGTYNDCNGDPQMFVLNGFSGYDSETFCAQEGSVSTTGEVVVTPNGPCPITTTTTTTV